MASATKWHERPNSLSGRATKCDRLVIPTDGKAELRMNSPQIFP